MQGTYAVLNLVGSPMAAMTAKVLLAALILAAAVLGGRYYGADARLTYARRQTAEVAAELDRALAELAVTRDDVSRLERDLAEHNESTRIAMATADQRLAEAQRAADRTEAIARARETRIKALLAANPRAAESRCAAANRLITDALRGQSC